MNVDELVDILDDHGFVDTSAERKVETINDVVNDINSRQPWRFLESDSDVVITAGDATPEAPVDFAKVLSFVIPAANIVLKPYRADVVRKQWPQALTITGTPFAYYFVGSNLHLLWVPDANYTGRMHYLRNQPELTITSAEDDILLPSRHHRVIALGALARLYAMEDDTDLATYFDAQYERRILTMEQDISLIQYDEHDSILDVWDDGEV